MNADLPQYIGYEVERAEVTNSGNGQIHAAQTGIAEDSHRSDGHLAHSDP